MFDGFYYCRVYAVVGIFAGLKTCAISASDQGIVQNC